MKITAFLCVVAVPGLACGCGSEDSKGPPIPAPEPVCDPIPAVDTSSPDHVVTSETELRTALEAGGVIVYDTGGAPETVTVPSELAVTRNTVVDGQGLLTIDGGGASRIFNFLKRVSTESWRWVVRLR